MEGGAAVAVAVPRAETRRRVVAPNAAACDVRSLARGVSVPSLQANALGFFDPFDNVEEWRAAAPGSDAGFELVGGSWVADADGAALSRATCASLATKSPASSAGHVRCPHAAAHDALRARGQRFSRVGTACSARVRQ
jgi:hypothetical protein